MCPRILVTAFAISSLDAHLWYISSSLVGWIWICRFRKQWSSPSNRLLGPPLQFAHHNSPLLVWDDSSIPAGSELILLCDRRSRIGSSLNCGVRRVWCCASQSGSQPSHDRSSSYFLLLLFPSLIKKREIPVE